MKRILAVSTAAVLTATGSALAAKPKIKEPPKLQGKLAVSGAVSLVRVANKQPVLRLMPGWYTVTVSDLSRSLGYTLAGPGVDKSTGKRFRGAVMWGIHFRPGTYHVTSGAATGRTFRVAS